jgi:hypothetical protein
MSRRTIIWLILTTMAYVFTIFTMIEIFGYKEGVLRGIFSAWLVIPAMFYCVWIAKENDDEHFDGEGHPEPGMKFFVIAEMIISVGLWLCKWSNTLII